MASILAEMGDFVSGLGKGCSLVSAAIFAELRMLCENRGYKSTQLK